MIRNLSSSSLFFLILLRFWKYFQRVYSNDEIKPFPRIFLMCSACPTYLCTKCEGGGKGYFIILTVSFPHLIFSRIYMCEWLEGFFSSLIRYVFSIFFCYSYWKSTLYFLFCFNLKKKIGSNKGHQLISWTPSFDNFTYIHLSASEAKDPHLCGAFRGRFSKGFCLRYARIEIRTRVLPEIYYWPSTGSWERLHFCMRTLRIRVSCVHYC